MNLKCPRLSTDWFFNAREIEKINAFLDEAECFVGGEEDDDEEETD